jgi:Ran GTPase-activating protein (RanGAP) involved in mRNA processing and transport
MKRQAEDDIPDQVDPKRQKVDGASEQQSDPVEMQEKILQILQSRFRVDIDALKATLAEVTKLDLRNSDFITEEQVLSLAEALKSNTSLTELNLENNQIGASGGASIAEALKSNTSLTTLNLSWNQIGASGGASIAEALKSNTSLTELNLENNQIEDSGGAAIGEALRSNTSLTSLYLLDNKIGASAGASIADALKSNTSLTSLDLSWNQIGASGGASIAEALKSNTSLTTLDLQSNQIGASGGTSIAEALKSNTSLITLDLQSNQIGASGGASITEALKSNTSLITLNFSWNEIGDSAGKAICTYIARNVTLAELSEVQKQLLEAIESDKVEAKLLYQYQHLTACNLLSRLQAVSNKIDTYISENYFQLVGVCKNVGDDLWHRLPLDIRTEVLSYLWPHSLLPQLFLKMEENTVQPQLPYETYISGDLYTESV